LSIVDGDDTVWSYGVESTGGFLKRVAETKLWVLTKEQDHAITSGFPPMPKSATRLGADGAGVRYRIECDTEACVLKMSFPFSI